jgi:hypothetical protein
MVPVGMYNLITLISQIDLLPYVGGIYGGMWWGYLLWLLYDMYNKEKWCSMSLCDHYIIVVPCNYLLYT